MTHEEILRQEVLDDCREKLAAMMIRVSIFECPECGDLHLADYHRAPDKPRDTFDDLLRKLEAALKELEKFERRENDFLKKERQDRAVELKLYLDNFTSRRPGRLF